MKNKIAIKLMLYFTGVLVVFGLIIGGVFYQFFKEHTVEIKRNSMAAQAKRLAYVISDNMERLSKNYGDGIANSRFINFLDNTANEIVWVVDSERNLNVNKERMQRMQRKRLKKQSQEGISDTKMPPPPILPKDPKDAYAKLPEHIRMKVEEGFQGNPFVVEEYNEWLDGIMLTVGEPVRDKEGKVRAVVLLHSPVQGLHDAVWAGLRILLWSLVAALVLGLLLSVVLSWRFTKPLQIMRNNAERLAERDYQARNNLVQANEVGELART